MGKHSLAPDFGADLNDDGALHQFTAAELVRLAEKLTGAAVAAAYEAGRRSAMQGSKVAGVTTMNPAQARAASERAQFEAVRLEATSAFQDVLDELAQAHARLAREHEAAAVLREATQTAEAGAHTDRAREIVADPFAAAFDGVDVADR
jgi:hypothetical protein